MPSTLASTPRYQAGHSHKETIERLSAVDCSILTTSECGAITIELDKKAEIKRFLK